MQGLGGFELEASCSSEILSVGSWDSCASAFGAGSMLNYSANYFFRRAAVGGLKFGV